MSDTQFIHILSHVNSWWKALFSNYFDTFDHSMDYQFWIWLIVIVITLIARANKKKPQPLEPEHPDSQSPAEKPISFEDLLREIQAAKSPNPKPTPTVTPVPVPQATQYDKVEDYDDDLKDEAEVLEKTDYRNEDEIYETYERAKREAFNKQSLEESMHVEDTKVSFEQFGKYKKRIKAAKVGSEFVMDLKNPSSFKKAFILSEVLNRRFWKRHFLIKHYVGKA